MRNLALALSLLLFPALSYGAAEKTRVRHEQLAASTNDYNLLETVALNAAAATRTITVTTGTLSAQGVPVGTGYSKMVVRVFATRVAYTTITAAFTCSSDGTNYASRTTRDCTSGACDLYPLADTRTTSSSENFTIEYDVRDCQSAKVVFGGANAGGTDTVDVQVSLIAGD